MIIENLLNKDLNPKVKNIIINIKDNYNVIKEEFINDKTDSIDYILNNGLYN